MVKIDILNFELKYKNDEMVLDLLAEYRRLESIVKNLDVDESTGELFLTTRG